MHPRTRLETVMAAPLTTGNLLADCERWCRDTLPPRESGPATVPAPRPAPRERRSAPERLERRRAPVTGAAVRAIARTLTEAAKAHHDGAEAGAA
ncbi:hypothetical protein ACI798_01945 [Geodermatophilus sp. SYSU D01045]